MSGGSRPFVSTGCISLGHSDLESVKELKLTDIWDKRFIRHSGGKNETKGFTSFCSRGMCGSCHCFHFENGQQPVNVGGVC